MKDIVNEKQQDNYQAVQLAKRPPKHALQEEENTMDTKNAPNTSTPIKSYKPFIVSARATIPPIIEPTKNQKTPTKKHTNILHQEASNP